MEKQLFQQLEKITQMGILIVFIFMALTGLVIYEGLHPLSEAEIAAGPNSFYCGTVEEVDLNANETLGKALFLENCASCHNNDMVSDMVGPALRGVEDRWKKYDDAIYAWIQNSEALAESGNPKAKSMIEWSLGRMTSFENLDKEQIDNILAYIDAK